MEGGGEDTAEGDGFLMPEGDWGGEWGWGGYGEGWRIPLGRVYIYMCDGGRIYQCALEMKTFVFVLHRSFQKN